MEALHYPDEVIQTIRDVADCNLYFFDHAVERWQMLIILLVSIVLLVGVYVFIHVLKEKKKLKEKSR